MRDAIKTGIALVLLALAMALFLLAALAYARSAGWLEPSSTPSLFFEWEDAAEAGSLE